MRLGTSHALINPVVAMILGSPVHRILSRSLMLLTYTGRKTGRRRTVPVMYARDGETVIVFVGRPEGKRWWRNLRPGAPVTLRIGGALREGFGEVVTGDAAAVVPGLRTYLAKFPRAAGSIGPPERAVMVRIRLGPATGQRTPAGAERTLGRNHRTSRTGEPGETEVTARTLAIAAIVTITAGVVLAAGASGQPGSPDTRQRLALPPAGRDKVLAEMRLMLESVNGILQAVVENNLPAVEKAARASGMAMAADVDPQLMTALPQAFRTLGMQTHRGFDALADRMRTGGTRDDALYGLARITNNCVACHAIYRLDESR